MRSLIIYGSLTVVGAFILACVFLAAQPIFVESSYANFATIIAALLVVVPVITTLGRMIQARLSTFGADKTSWLAFLPFAVLVLLTAGLVIVGFFAVIPLGIDVLFSENPPPPKIVAALLYSSALPVFLLALLFLLLLKTLSSTMLDRQKLHLRDMIVARLESPVVARHRPTVVPDHGPSDGDREAFRGLLNRLCESALQAASETGLKTFAAPRFRTASAYVLHPQTGEFVLVATAGGTAAYWEALKHYPPKVLDIERFAGTYDEYCKRRAPTDGVEFTARLHRFRKEVQPYASTPGVVLATERPLAFDDVYGKCMTTDFAHLNHLPKSERWKFLTRQLVAIPLACLDRKIGVLILASRKKRTFYTSDRIYWILGDLISSVIEYGLACGLFIPWGISSKLSDYPARGEDAETIGRAIEVITTVTPRFDRFVQGTAHAA